MKFFGWVQNKFNGKQGSNNKSKVVLPPTYHMKEAPREDLSPDWPQKLLTIGTFGNDALINGRISNPLPDPPPEEDPSPSSIQEFTPEEVGELQKELTKLLSKKPTSQVEKELLANLPLDRFLNCPSSLEVDRRISSALGDECSENYDQEEGDNNNEDIERTITAILGRCKDICSDINNKKKGVIGKKSIAFLLKKMFVCGTGSFAPQPSLRDTLQESRIEKLLRTMLHKKIYTQNPASRTSSTKRILEDHKKTPSRQQNDEDETRDRNSSADGHKWVKTDSEYIVLEI